LTANVLFIPQFQWATSTADLQLRAVFAFGLDICSVSQFHRERVAPDFFPLMLVINLVRGCATEAAIAKIMPKKKRTATATAPNNVMIFTFMCGVASHNLTLFLYGGSMFGFLIYAYS
jgi:hypothetical protein